MTSGKYTERTLGVVLVLAGTMLFSIMDALIKWLSTTYPITQIAFFRSAIALSLIATFVVFTRKFSDLKPNKTGLHFLRSLLGVVITLTGFYALKHISLVEVMAIAHSVPIFIAILAPWFLDETVSARQWLIICVGFLGVLIIIRPSPDHFHIAHLIMLGGAIAYTFMIITGRYMANTESQIAMNFYLYPLTAIITGILSHNNWVAPADSDWLLLIAMGICATLALVCYMKAIKHVEVTVIAPLDYAAMIWAIILSYSIWNELPDPLTWVGIVLIIASGIYLVTHRKKITEAEVTQALEH